MVSAPSEAPTLPLHVTHAGRTLEFSLPRSSPLTDLISQLSSHFDLSPSSLKLVIKGKKISLVSSSDSDQARTVGGAFAEAFGSSAVAAGEGGSAEKPLKALLVGTKRSSFESVQAAESLRSKKHDAFLHHQSHRPPPPSRAGGVHTIANGEDDPERYRFYELQPFPETVPMLEKRMAMLKRLAEDPAVKDVMRRHKFVVGVLTELHPILQPTLLGLNTNAGQKIALRLLTDSLDGTRSYTEIRRVLLHELAHNSFGEHGNDFKTLNSLLNKEVATFESSPDFEAWDPAASAEPREETHTLNEVEAERVWEKLRFGLEDEVEERRERAGRAAEERLRRRAG